MHTRTDHGLEGGRKGNVPDQRADQGDGVADGVRSIEIDERLRDSTSGSPAEDGSTSGVSSGEPDETDQRETSEEPSLLSSTKDVTKNCKSRHVMPSANKFKSKTSAAAGEDSDTGTTFRFFQGSSL